MFLIFNFSLNAASKMRCLQFYIDYQLMETHELYTLVLCFGFCLFVLFLVCLFCFLFVLFCFVFVCFLFWLLQSVDPITHYKGNMYVEWCEMSYMKRAFWLIMSVKRWRRFFPHTNQHEEKGKQTNKQKITTKYYECYVDFVQSPCMSIESGYYFIGSGWAYIYKAGSCC